MKQHIVRIALGLALMLAVRRPCRRFLQYRPDHQAGQHHLRRAARAHHARRGGPAHRHPRHRRAQPGQDRARALALAPRQDFRTAEQACSMSTASSSSASTWCSPSRTKVRACRCSTRLAKGELKGVGAVPVGAQRPAPGTRLRRHVSPKTIKGRPVVLGYYFNSEANAMQSGAVPRAGAARGDVPGPQHRLHAAGRAMAATCRSFRPTRPMPGTSIRWSTPTACRGECRCLPNSDGAYYEALSLAMIRVLAGYPKVEPGFASGRARQYGLLAAWNGSRSARSPSRWTIT